MYGQGEYDFPKAICGKHDQALCEVRFTSEENQKTLGDLTTTAQYSTMTKEASNIPTVDSGLGVMILNRRRNGIN